MKRRLGRTTTRRKEKFVPSNVVKSRLFSIQPRYILLLLQPWTGKNWVCLTQSKEPHPSSYADMVIQTLLQPRETSVQITLPTGAPVRGLFRVNLFILGKILNQINAVVIQNDSNSRITNSRSRTKFLKEMISPVSSRLLSPTLWATRQHAWQQFGERILHERPSNIPLSSPEETCLQLAFGLLSYLGHPINMKIWRPIPSSSKRSSIVHEGSTWTINKRESGSRMKNSKPYSV
jgi:hypothetical protein